MKNAYAAKIRTAHALLKNEERKKIVHQILTTVYYASAVALNEQFGFGADRIAKYREAMEAVIMEYGDFMNETDTDYADGKLEERFKKIMNGK